MSLIIDAIILGIILLFTFIGYKQGLIKSAIKILTFIIAIIVAFTLYKPISKLIISNTEIDNTIQNIIVEKILPEGTNTEQVVEEEMSISKSILNTANKTVNEIGEIFAIKIIQVGTFLILFLGTKIILKFISALSTLITKLPIIKQMDKTGGFIYGIIKGILIVYLLLAIISLAAPLLQSSFIEEINNSIIGGLFYKYNLLLIFIF